MSDRHNKLVDSHIAGSFVLPFPFPFFPAPGPSLIFAKASRFCCAKTAGSVNFRGGTCVMCVDAGSMRAWAGDEL